MYTTNNCDIDVEVKERETEKKRGERNGPDGERTATHVTHVRANASVDTQMLVDVTSMGEPVIPITQGR